MALEDSACVFCLHLFNKACYGPGTFDTSCTFLRKARPDGGARSGCANQIRLFPLPWQKKDTATTKKKKKVSDHKALLGSVLFTSFDASALLCTQNESVVSRTACPYKDRDGLFLWRLPFLPNTAPSILETVTTVSRRRTGVSDRRILVARTSRRMLWKAMLTPA